MNNIKTEYNLFDKIYLVYIFIYANLFISPLFALIPFSVWQLITVITFFLLFASYTRRHTIDKIFVFLFVISAITFSLPALFYQDINPITNNIAYLFVMVLFCFFKEKYINPFITYSTIFICILIVGAYIGFLYALVGGAPTFTYNGAEGRRHLFYLTTSVPANAVLGRFIRPGGIYDEPGSLSSFICSICLLRVLYRRNDNKTLFILLAGLITFSLFHLIIVFCFFVYYLIRNRRKKSTIFFIAIMALIFISLIILFYDAVEQILLSRLKMTSDGRLAGDTRIHSMMSALSLINNESFFWGIGTDIYYNPRNYLYFNDNPLTLLARYGLFASWYYYVFLIIIFIAGIFKRRYFLIFLAMGLTFFPHPYPNIISYSFYFGIFFHSALLNIKSKWKV